MPQLIRVLCVDDQSCFLGALRELIEAVPGFIGVGEVSSGEDAVRAAESLRPDLVLMDVRMPGMDGFEAAERIIDRDRSVVVVLMSAERQPLPPVLEQQRRVGFIEKERLSPRVVRDLYDVHSAQDAAVP